MKRRQALRQLGVGFSSALVGASWLSSCKKDDLAPEIQYDGNVIVIGAGVAGLYAADILMTKGLNVTILEASKQIGGRIASLRNQLELPYQSIADFPVELGAEYWQGADSTLGKLVSNLGLPVVKVPKESIRYILGTQVKTEADWGADGDFASVQAFMNGLKSYSGPANSVAGAASVSANAEPLLNSQAGNFYGSSADKVGVKGLSEQLKLVSHDSDYYVLQSNTLQDLMISRFFEVYDKVIVESPVKSINYSANDIITITMEDGTQMTANKVVVTVPVTILKNGIEFLPALPSEKVNALNNIGMDPSMRVVMDFKKNFWGVDSSFIWGGTEGPQYFSAGVQRSELTQTITVTINGAKAQELSDLGDGDLVVKKLLAELDKLYAGQATQFIRKTIPTDEEPDEKMIYYIKDWTKEKYIGGGSSYPMINTTLDHRTALMSPINDRLFFAGEATDISGEPGTVNGAMASAERVAEDVVQSIKKVS